MPGTPMRRRMSCDKTQNIYFCTHEHESTLLNFYFVVVAQAESCGRLGLPVSKHIPTLPPTNSLKRGTPILSHLCLLSLTLSQELVCLDLFFCNPMLSRFSTVSNVCELSRILR